MNAISDWVEGGQTLYLQLSPAVAVTQDQFEELCEQNPTLRLERSAQGELIVAPAAGGASARRELALGTQLYIWVEREGDGEAFGASAGYILPNGANRSPDASWICSERLKPFTAADKEKFMSLCPDFAVEVLSPTDRVKATQEKMVEYMANGLRLGLMVDPFAKKVHLYRQGQPVQILVSPATVSCDPELPGFELNMEKVW